MISIIIPVHNGLDYTRECIESIQKYTCGHYELIVVDNASNDGTVRYLKEEGCTIIRNDQNVGCAPSWNQGIVQSHFDWICILNNDTVLSPGWDERLRQVMDAHDLGAAMPAVYEGPFDYSLTSASEMHWATYGASVIPGAWNGVCMMVRRSTFDVVGQFDERYRFGKYEDADFMRRLGDAGLQVGLACGVLIHHFGSKTVDMVKASVGWNFEEENHRQFLREFRWGRAGRELLKFKTKFVRRKEQAFNCHSRQLIDQCRRVMSP